MSEISLDHYIGRQIVKVSKDSIVLDGDVNIFNDDDTREIEKVPKGSRLALVVMDVEETTMKFIGEDEEYYDLTLTATKHSLSDPERTQGEKVALQRGVDQRDLSVPPEPSERDSEHPIHVAERQASIEGFPKGKEPEADD
jgi:hypothetical protein